MPSSSIGTRLKINICYDKWRWWNKLKKKIELVDKEDEEEDVEDQKEEEDAMSKIWAIKHMSLIP